MPANKNKYKPTTWGTEPTIDLEVPSGQTCLVRRPGPTGLMKAGLLDELDFLSGIVASEHVPRAEGRDVTTVDQMKDIMADKEKLLRAIDLMDKVIEYVVVEPRVLRPLRRDINGKPLIDERGREIPLEDLDREPGAVYTDSIALEDKSFIFQFVVGGTADLAAFRSEYSETLGSLEGKSALPSATE